MKSGVVCLIGNANVGKSTIFNLLSGQKLSIVTNKPQTTRDYISSVINIDDNVIFLQDVPGFIQKKRNILDKKMTKNIKIALAQSDVIILVLNEQDLNNEQNLFLKNINIDIVILNKIDLINIQQSIFLKNKIKELYPKAELLEMSAINGFNKEKLISLIIDKLPAEKKIDFISVKKDEKFFCSEVIREKIFLLLQKEIPYSTTVLVEDIKKESDIIFVFAKIIVFRESQKKIIIGHQGRTIKQIRVNSEKDLKRFFSKKVKLDLFVKVDDWMRSDKILQRYSHAN